MKLLFKYLRSRYWWYLLFTIEKVPEGVYGRCTVCDAGNPTILCGTDCYCPCKHDECLKSISDKFGSDYINNISKC